MLKKLVYVDDVPKQIYNSDFLGFRKVMLGDLFYIVLRLQIN